MQADARASYRRIVERIAGTFAGVLAAWLLTLGLPPMAFIYACILVVAPLIPHHLANRYWLHTALIALMILLAYDLANGDGQGLLSERVVDMLLGCAIALVGTAAAFARPADLYRRSRRSGGRAAERSPAAARRWLGMTDV